jgi:hypothetical protein
MFYAYIKRTSRDDSAYSFIGSTDETSEPWKVIGSFDNSAVIDVFEINELPAISGHIYFDFFVGNL